MALDESLAARTRHAGPLNPCRAGVTLYAANPKAIDAARAAGKLR
jgi:hypothetical protein